MFGGLQKAVQDDEYDSIYGVSENIINFPTQTPPPVKSDQQEKIPPCTLKQALRNNGHTLVDLCNEINGYRKISYRQIKKYSSKTAVGHGHTWMLIDVILKGWGIEFG